MSDQHHRRSRAASLDVTVDFTPPEAAERRTILQLHLPAAHAVSPAMLDDVARQCPLTGGQIRKAALYAALLTFGNGALMGDDELGQAIQREYRRAGAAYPLRDLDPEPRPVAAP